MAEASWDSTWWLADTESMLLSNLLRWKDEPDKSKKWSIWQQSLDLVSRACGYQCQMPVYSISSDFQVAHFKSVAQWGADRYQQNDGYSLQNHINMATDRPRIEAYRSALDRAARWRNVLDVGCGPFCLLSRFALQAGAGTVHSVEQNSKAVQHAVDMFEDEASGHAFNGLCNIGASLSGYDLVGKNGKGAEPRLSLSVGAAEKPFQRKLCLFEGFSCDTPLPGGYDLVVHEILGHVASSEGVVEVLRNLRHRGLLTPDCVFVPQRAATWFVPTMEIKLGCLERILCLSSGRQESDLRCLTKFHARRFPQNVFLATPALFEDLEFNGEMQTQQHSIVKFVTDRSGVFDGLHFHMVVDLDGHFSINTLIDQTSWETTYVRLLDPGIFLDAGSRIVCKTWIYLDRPDPVYYVEVYVGDEKVAEFSWSGCSG